MRVNIYAEEMTDRVEIISKVIDGVTFTGLRIYLYLPVTLPEKTDWAAPGGNHIRGPFLHHEGDDDSSAITFWGKADLHSLVALMKTKLDEHYGVAQ